MSEETLLFSSAGECRVCGQLMIRAGLPPLGTTVAGVPLWQPDMSKFNAGAILKIDDTDMEIYTSHHLQQSPVDNAVCLGCFMATTQVELFILRATGRTAWTLQVERLLTGIVEQVKKGLPL